MKSMKEIKREWFAWLIRDELLPNYPDAAGDLPGGWRALARETAAFYERGEKVPHGHWKKADAAHATASAAHAAATNAASDVAADDAIYAAANVAANAANAAANVAADDYAVCADAAAADAYRRMAEALVRIADLAPMPELDARILADIELGGSTLNMDKYHTCDTTHCRAGFAVTIHPRGMELEEEFGPHLTGAAIYLASTGVIPDFFATDDDAMASIRKGATR